MQLNELNLKDKSNLINDYREQNEAITSFFDYKPFESYQARLDELKTRTFNRLELTKVLDEMNRAWGADKTTLNNIDQLKKEEAVVVIGGQQAGLLTGPMYTVNKIISIITLAKQQEKALGVPVIPVFWIAGEDHDYDEINHIYTNRNNRLHKHIVGQNIFLKHSLSHVNMDKLAVKEWLIQAFQGLNETSFTKDIYEVISACLEQSATYVDFCARLVFQLFPDEGIVLVDSGDDAIRHLESPYFEHMIDKQAQIGQTVFETIQKLTNKAYDIPLDVERNDAHLFYHDNNNERVLLHRIEDKWVGKNAELVLTTEELIKTAQNDPTKLSNNVVTRPLMQDFLFPTLSFVAGDGEISYWAGLQKMFHAFDVKMPPVLPRLSMTYVPTRINKLLETRELTASHVINNDIKQDKDNWLNAQHDYSVDKLISQVKGQLEIIHKPLQEAASEISDDIASLANKNLVYLNKELSFLQKKMLTGIERKHETTLTQFDEIEHVLKPNKGLQERIWSPLPFVNEVGADFIKDLIKLDLSFENNHYLVKLG